MTSSIKAQVFSGEESGILYAVVMQRHEKKKRRQIKLFITYAVMTIAVVAISIVCILLVMGYRFNFEKSRLEQGALLQFRSAPSGAQIYLNDEKMPFNTPGKREVKVGQHDVTISRKGYRDWTKSFNIKAGEVRWLNYARLVPTTVSTSTVKTVEGATSVAAAPNHRYIAVVEKADTPVVTVFDVNDSKKIKNIKITIPKEKLTLPEGAQHGYKLVEWNLASKYLLVNHTFNDQQEFLRLTVDDFEDVVNISTKFAVPMRDVHFSENAQVYGVENGNLRRFDVASGSMSEPLAQNVVSMNLYSAHDFVYVSHVNNRYEVRVIVDRAQSKRVATYDNTVPVRVDLSKYFNEYYVAIARGASFEMVKNPQKDADHGLKKVLTLTLPGEASWIDMSPDGRFAVVGNGTKLITYDIELKDYSNVTFPGNPSDPSRAPSWLDDYLLVSTADNKLRISDFDGDNQQIITDALPYLPVMLSGDGSLLYNFASNHEGAIVLQSSKMTAN